MANNYNIIADHIVEKYIKRISGEDIEETFVDDAPDTEGVLLRQHKTEKERDDAFERLKAVRKENSNLSSELQSVKAEVKRSSEVYTMLERIAPLFSGR